jgi:hypothetical protein
MITLRALAHPGWCAGDINLDESDVHISVDETIELASGRERHEVYVSLEQAPDAPAAVRLQGAGDVPMSPAHAVRLGMTLIAKACEAVTR